MRNFIYILIAVMFLPVKINAQFVQQQRKLDGNNIAAYIINTGIADRNVNFNNTPGFEWPKESGNFAIFTSGLTIAAKVNGQIRMAAASYSGEYRPGYILNGVTQTDSRFHIFSIKRGDTSFTNTDYAEWGNMVPYGAPFVDVNNNGTFELGIDKPGVKDASQTVFLCMTDGFSESHILNEGFGGGTDPLMAEVHFTSWSYDNMGLEDVQFRKWEIVNKSGSAWNGAIFSIVSDPDLGDATDDWIGCDTTLNLAYCYNGTNIDGLGGPGTYGVSPPAVGINFLKTPRNSLGHEFGMTSFLWLRPTLGAPQPLCELFPKNPLEAYNNMKGLKRDGTPWINPRNNKKTSYVFSGDPEPNQGWTESFGSIDNCNGDTTGNYFSPNNPGDRRMVLSTADSLYNMSSGQKVDIVTSFQIARGSNHLNSVTKLKHLTNIIRNYWQTIGITPISTEVPESFRLHQNYPNPFNPATKIRFEISGSKGLVKLTVYDIAGKEVARLVNEELQPGVYEYDFSATGGGLQLASGMYFYRLETVDFVETRKMVLVK